METRPAVRYTGHMRVRWGWVGLAAVLGAAPAGARIEPPVPCPNVHFLAGVPLLGTTPFDPIVIDDGGLLSIPGCAPVLARRSRSRSGTVARARWDTCGSATAVRLRARYDAGCTTLGGVLRRRHVRAVHFAAAPSACGDGLLDPNTEECELTTPCPAPGTTCIDCHCQTATTTTTSVGATTTSTLAGLFEALNPWNTDVSALAPSPQSASIIGALAAAGGWGNGNRLQIDFSIHLLHVLPTTAFFTFVENAGYYLPDCDPPFPFPLPAGGAIEGQAGYSCDVANEDCHLLVVDPAAKRLYEMYQATVTGGTLSATCAVVWDLTRGYPPNLRGDQCTSADAGGFPIGAMLFDADEVAAGEIPHAIRFILPNPRIRAGVYVHPASHAGGPTGGSTLPPYGVRFRLRADFPLDTLPSDGARVIARAMQRYGMLLADGGNIALTAASDVYTAHTWSEVGVDSHSLFAIQVTDMEVVDLPAPVALTYDCVRNP
jgi:hypothetical protein